MCQAGGAAFIQHSARENTGPNYPVCTIRSRGMTHNCIPIPTQRLPSGSCQRRGRDDGNRRQRQQRKQHNGARQTPLLIYSWSPTRLLSLSPCCLCFTENRRITWPAWSSHTILCATRGTVGYKNAITCPPINLVVTCRANAAAGTPC